MTREVRANLIFVVVLVLLVAPGFVFLMKKKLNGGTRPNFMPDPAPHQIAYIQPLPAPPVPRVEPALVRDWVTGLVEKRLDAKAGERRRRVYAPSPVVSDRFVTELVGMFWVGDRMRVVLLRWEDTRNLADAVNHDAAAVRVTSGGKVAYDTVAVEPVDVPPDVRHALQDVGYVDPPARVWWIAADSPAGAATSLTQNLTLTTPGTDGKPVTEVLTEVPSADGRPVERPTIEVLP